MTIEVQYKLNNDPKLKRFLRENSYWYKELNRNPLSFNSFSSDMKDKYELKPTDKLNKFFDNISTIQRFLDVFK